MRYLFFLLSLFFSITVNAQNYVFGYNLSLGTPEMYISNTPTNNAGNRYVVMRGRDSTDLNIRVPHLRFRSIRWDATPRTDLKNIVSVDDSGWIYRGNIYSILDTSSLIATRYWILSRGFMQHSDTATMLSGYVRANGSSGQYIAGNGTKVTFPSIPPAGVTSVSFSSTDFSVSGSPVTSGGTITANLNTSGVTAGTYERVTVNNKGIATGGTNPTVTDVTRTINSASTYTISSTQQSDVVYYITISCTASIGSAASGSVLFQWSTNGGSSWNDGGIVSNSNQVTLAVTLNSVNTNTFPLVWDGIPANALCRLVPSTTGTTTITWVRGREKVY